MNIGILKFDGSRVRSNMSLTNTTKNIIKNTQPKPIIVGGYVPRVVSSTSSSLDNITKKIIKETKPGQINESQSSFKPVVVPYNTTSRAYNFIDYYNKPETKSENTIVTKEVTREIIREVNNTTSFDMPSGSIMQFISDIAPNGWLLCDGSEILIAEYNDLYNVIKNTYGEASDSKYFKLPDFRGRVSIGAGEGNGLSKRNLGELGGEEKHKLTLSEIPVHSHNGTTLNGGNHTHNVNDPGHEHIINTANKSGNNTVPNTFNKNDKTRIDNKQLTSTKTNKETTDISIGPNGDHTHEFTTNNVGGGQEHNIMQPYLVTNYIIKF
jgi:microcystin-dependent protein